MRADGRNEIGGCVCVNCACWARPCLLGPTRDAIAASQERERRLNEEVGRLRAALEVVASPHPTACCCSPRLSAIFAALSSSPATREDPICSTPGCLNPYQRHDPSKCYTVKK